MKIATWNINSVRLRLGLVENFLREMTPDILCLQETKTQDAFFPADAFAALGYGHQLVHGMKSYNGVAILSRLAFHRTEKPARVGRDDCRHGIAVLENGLEIHNLYIPAGGDVADPTVNDKFAHKLDFIDELIADYTERSEAGRSMILVGDLNIAPLEHDVWSHKQLLDVVSHTPVEVERLGRMQAAGRFVDSVRHFVPADQKLYSWWSYRAKDWNAADKGRRLDHIWVTPDLENKLESASIYREARGWERSSDHAPVILSLS